MILKFSLVIIFIFICNCSFAQQQYVDDFYRYAITNGITVENLEFEFSIVPLESANGKSTKIHDHWLIEIDSDFFTEYHDKSQMRRLVFHELGHILLNLDDVDRGNTVMNPHLIYYPLTENLIKDLFKRKTNSF